MMARKIWARVGDKANIGSDHDRGKRPRRTAAALGRSKEAEKLYPDISQPAEHNEQFAKASERNEISLEVQDWLDRVVLPILKKVIFDE